MVRRPHDAPVCRRGAPAAAGLVGDFRRRRPNRSAALDLRPRRQTIWTGGCWVKRIDLEDRESFSLNGELKTEWVFSSPCGGAKPMPVAPANSAARFPALPGSSVWRGCTFLFRDMRGPGCNEESGAARNGGRTYPLNARGNPLRYRTHRSYATPRRRYSCP